MDGQASVTDEKIPLTSVISPCHNCAPRLSSERNQIIMASNVSTKPANVLSYLGFAEEPSLNSGQFYPTATSLSRPAAFKFLHASVFVAIDIELHCYNRQICEIGLAWLDTRELAAVAPGDRGISWIKKIKSRHFRIIDNVDDPVLSKCRCFHHKGHSTHFAYGISLEIKSASIKQNLERWLGSIEKLRLAPSETKRHIVLCSWASTCEEVNLRLQHVDWYFRADNAWDIQKAGFARHLGKQLGKSLPALSDLLLYSGILAPVDEPYCSILHNAGNDAVLELQGFLACTLFTQEQDQRFGTIPFTLLPRLFRPDIIETNRGFQLPSYIRLHYGGK